MASQPPAGPGNNSGQPQPDSNGPGADWNSPAWGEPHTVAASWPTAPTQAPTTFAPAPPPPPRRRSRGLLITASAGVAAAALVGALFVDGAFARDSTTAAPSPSPSASAPAIPTLPSPTPTSPSQQDPSQQDPSQQDPSQQDPSQQDPSQQDPSQQDPSQQDPSQQDPSQQDPSQQDPSQQDPSQQDPSQQDPSQQDPSQQDPSAQAPDQASGQDAPKLTDKQKAAVATVTPGLVDIVSTIGYDGSEGAGTGEVLTSDGTVLTNHHVVAGATSIKVTDLGNGKIYTAKVVGYDSSHDVAVIKLADASGLTTAPLGDSSTVAVGDAVVGLGNALGKGGAPSPAAGQVTGLDKSITAQDESGGSSENLTGLIETDAPIQPGDSGGSLISADAKVIGMITAGSTSGSDSGPVVGAAASDQTATDGYAIPINEAKSIADEIIAGKSSDTVHIGGSPFLGVQVSDDSTSASVSGVSVAGTVAGSAAAKAGLVAGDVVTGIDGHDVKSGASLKSALADHKPGDSVKLTWTGASGTSHSAQVTLTDGPVG